MSHAASPERVPPGAKRHGSHAGAPVPCLTCAHNACAPWPRALQRPPTPTPDATLLSARCSALVCRLPVPPWRHHRHARGATTRSHAPHAPGWHAGWGSTLSPPPPVPPSVSAWTSMPPTPPPRPIYMKLIDANPHHSDGFVLFCQTLSEDVGRRVSL